MKWCCRTVIVLSLFALTWSASSQTLVIQVLDGKSGKPLANQRVVVMGQSGSEGARRIGDFHTEANGNIAISPIDPQVRSLSVYVEWHHLCAKHQATFSVMNVSSTGLVSENSCNPKIKRTAEPGTLILFVRDETLFEKMAH
jgi:5-hydroxyisourate hydrolase-like protein (transthyretin family)